MGKERILELTKKKETRTSGFIHIGEIIPGVVRDLEKRIKESHTYKNKKTSFESRAGKEPL